MKRQKTITFLGLIGLLLSLPALAAVYMEKDAQGNVIFTDRPSTENAKPIKLNPLSTYKAPAIPSASSGSQTRDQNDTAQGYEFIAITQPTDDSPVRENSGELEVSINLSPDLKASHHIMLLMDGMPVDEGQSTTLHVQNVDRGTHTLQVQIVDDSGNVIISSESVTFHMLRM